MKKKIKNQKAEESPSEVRRFFWILVGVSGVLVLWALSLSLDRTGDIRQFMAQGWPQDAARVIVQNKIVAIWHASFMAAVVTAVFALFSFPTLGSRLSLHPNILSKHWKTVVAVALVLIVAVDAVKLSKHYVKEMPRSYIEANALTDFLQENVGHQRVALLTQEGIYGIWLTYLLPYNQITTFNFSQMPRMPEDYKNFLAVGSKNPLRMWQFAGVKYLLGPAAFERQLPAGQVKKVFTYDLASTGGEEFRLMPTPTGSHAVFELLGSRPRYAVVAPVQPMSDEQALATVTQRSPQQTALAKVRSYRPGRVDLHVTAEAPSMLRVAERWNSDWKASVDGEPAEVQRIDYLCQGISIPAGEHDVELRYAPSKFFFYMQCFGYMTVLMVLLLFFCRAFGRRNAGDIKCS